MRASWPEPVERVAAFLRDAGAEARLEQLREGAPTARTAADEIGCALEEVVKSLVLMCDDVAVLALVPGDRRVDPQKVARVVGAQGARIALAEEVIAATGFTPGAVAPFPLPAAPRIVLERTLLTCSVVWVGAGSDRHMVALSPLELVRLTRASVEDVVQESA